MPPESPIVTVREIFDIEDPAFASAIELYERTFPIDEREPIDSIERRIDRRLHWRPGNRRMSHFLVCEEAGKVVGMRIHEYYPGVRLGWLVYLAISPQYRRRGIGSQLLRCGIESLKLDALFCGEEFRGAVLEVERPMDAVSDEDRGVREQRLEFFNQQGVVKLTDTYTQPALGEDTHPVPLSLFLLGSPIQPSGEERASIVSDFLLKLWQMEPENPIVGKALAGVV